MQEVILEKFRVKSVFKLLCSLFQCLEVNDKNTETRYSTSKYFVEEKERINFKPCPGKKNLTQSLGVVGGSTL